MSVCVSVMVSIPEKCLLYDIRRLRHRLCALACLGRLISQIADAIVICLHPFVLAVHNRSYLQREVLLERCFIDAFCNVFAAFAFGQHRVIVLSCDRRFDVGPGAMQRTADRTGSCGFAAEPSYLGLQFGSTLVAFYWSSLGQERIL